MYNAQPDATERRRSPRIPLTDGQVDIVAPDSVRILDISGGGVLLASSRSAMVGSRGRLAFTVGDMPVTVDIDIRRVVAAADRSGYWIGAQFVDLPQPQRAAIERFARS